MKYSDRRNRNSHSSGRVRPQGAVPLRCFPAHRGIHDSDIQVAPMAGCASRRKLWNWLNLHSAPPEVGEEASVTYGLTIVGANFDEYAMLQVSEHRIIERVQAAHLAVGVGSVEARRRQRGPNRIGQKALEERLYAARRHVVIKFQHEENFYDLQPPQDTPSSPAPHQRYPHGPAPGPARSHGCTAFAPSPCCVSRTPPRGPPTPPPSSFPGPASEPPHRPPPAPRPPAGSPPEDAPRPQNRDASACRSNTT